MPTGNVPHSTLDLLRRDRTVGQVIPLALGDSFRNFRIVGTEPAYAAQYHATVAQGRMFAAPMEATVGTDVAARTGMKLGQRFAGSHGLGSGDGAHQHEVQPFTAVGVLARTGTVVDRLILTPVESVWDVHGIAHEEHEGGAGHEDHADEPTTAGSGHEHEEHAPETEAHTVEATAETAPAAPVIGARVEQEADVTALLVRYRSPLAAVRLPAFINGQTNLQAAVPAVEITRLLSLLGFGLDAARAFAILLMVTVGLSIFVALLNSLRAARATWRCCA